MDLYKQRIIKDIKEYALSDDAELITLEQIKLIDGKLARIKGALEDSEPVKSGSSHHEDEMCDLIDQKIELKNQLCENRKKRQIVEWCLERLSEEDRLILIDMCKAEKGDAAAIEIGLKIGKDERTIRRRWHEIMKKYQIIKGGCVVE